MAVTFAVRALPEHLEETALVELLFRAPPEMLLGTARARSLAVVLHERLENIAAASES